MESRHVSAVLFAADYLRLAAFYRDVVGLALDEQLDDHAILRYPGFTLVVHQVPARYLRNTGAAPPPRREGGVKLWFPVGDLDRVRRSTAALGGALDPPETEWVYKNERVCKGHDPEGNVFQVSAPGDRASHPA
jgi:predicted enzyme related to lactoylglutathione lyase